MKVWCRGGGLPMGEPKEMSLTRKGNREVSTESSSVSRQPLAMYGVVSIYKIELSSVACTGGGSVSRVPTQGAGVGRMASGRVMAGAFDIEDDTDCHSHFVDETPVFPVDDRWPIGSVRGGLARIGTMAECTTPEAEGVFGVAKGPEGVLI